MSRGMLDQVTYNDPAGLRWYRWIEEGQEPVDVLSVTSIRSACGMAMHLVNWQISNVVNTATGTTQVTRIGPRGGVKKAYEADGEFPGEFARQLLASEGSEHKLAAVRSWLREAAERPRDIAAMRGSVVHAAIESDLEVIDRDWIVEQFRREGRGRARRSPINPSEDDFQFVMRTVGQYWDFRRSRGAKMLARETPVWNLTLGYAGTFDSLEHLEGDPPEEYTILDYKTSEDLHTENVLQVHGYLGTEFAGSNGVRNPHVTDLLGKAVHGGLVHLRPEGWRLARFSFNPEVMQAFVGSVMLARFIADYDKPDHLFESVDSGRSST